MQVAYCIAESLSSYLFTRLTSIGCLSELCYVLRGHSISSDSLIRFRMVLQTKLSSPGGGASIHTFLWPRRHSYSSVIISISENHPIHLNEI